MYTREVGIERLSKHAQAMSTLLSDTEYTKGIHIDVPLNFFGVLPPDSADAEIFNSHIPNFKFISTGNEAWNLRSYGIKKNDFISSMDIVNGEMHCIEQAYNFANLFIVALSIATHAFVSWRQISLPDLVFHGNSLLRERPLHFAYPSASIKTTNTTLDKVHAGYLAEAFEVFSDLLSWDQKFIACYLKAEILLTAPSYADLNFCDESYLNYFRCLEYTAMEKVLKKYGNCDNHNLTNAMMKLGVHVNGDPSKKAISFLSNTLNRQRDNAVAHLTRSNLKAKQITGQDVYELKSLVDIFIIHHVITKQSVISTDVGSKLPS